MHCNEGALHVHENDLHMQLGTGMAREYGDKRCVKPVDSVAAYLKHHFAYRLQAFLVFVKLPNRRDRRSKALFHPQLRQVVDKFFT